MADVIIRNMKMPDKRTTELMRTELACVSRECDRCCESCDLVQDRDELIAAFRETIRVLEAVANAVPLPEGYGRLIDADALGDFPYNISFCDEGDVENWIASAPTIIPVEGGASNE